MKYLVWTLPLALLVPDARAAVKNYTADEREPVYEDGVRSYETLRQTYPFRMEIVGDDDGAKDEARRGGRPFIAARPGESYSIRLYNPLPVRAAVNVTVDGLNTISGKPSGIADGSKWMIEPGSYIVLRGWQVNAGEARRFFFTDKPGSYAAWQGEAHRLDLAANCGVIGAAFFWNRRELRDYLENHPVYRYTPKSWIFEGARDKGEGVGGDGASAMRRAAASSMGAAAPAAAAPPAAEQQAGTGMGERESHPTQQVEFDFDEGMYRSSSALLVYYDYPRPASRPNPFPSMSFASEMPDRGGRDVER
jgi:hypothetical protein